MTTTLTRVVGSAPASAALIGAPVLAPTAGAQDLGSLGDLSTSVEALAPLSAQLPGQPSNPITTPGASITEKRDHIEAELHRLLAQTRRDHGLPAVPWNTTLARDSRVWSEDIVRNGVRHDRLAPGVGENIHGTTADYTRVARSAVNGWLNSPGHRAILLNPQAKSYGAGVAWSPATGWWYVTYRMTIL